MSEAAVVTQEQQEQETEKSSGWRGPEGSRNTAGRPKEEDRKKVTRRSLRDKELMQLARKLRPHQSAAIMEAVRIMGNKEATDANKLKAVAFLSDTYRKLITEIYDGEPEEDDKGKGDEPVESQPQVPVEVLPPPVPVKGVDMRPVFSHRMVESPADLQKD